VQDKAARFAASEAEQPCSRPGSGWIASDTRGIWL
jgi:hypothetical protein